MSFGLVALRPESLLRLGTIELNGTVFVYALLVSLVTVIVFGFGPAISGSRNDGQRFLEMALAGPESPGQARAELRGELEKLITLEP